MEDEKATAEAGMAIACMLLLHETQVDVLGGSDELEYGLTCQ